MWCPNCKADVAAEVAADNRRVRCATCGAELTASSSFTGVAKTREARDLLERWASERRSESPAPRSTSAAERTSPTTKRAQPRGGINLEDDPSGSRDEVAGPQSGPPLQYRIDAPQPLAGPSAFESTRPPTANASYRAVFPQDAPRLHRQHEPANVSPHFDIQGSLIQQEHKKTNWTSVVGQLIAYVGVALLTVGTTLVVWSYFGGPASYAATGWLTTTAGQMLLFLGVVTLVSGGMEQTSEEVRTRIERLGERIIRIEQIAREQALRGPYIPPEYYAGSNRAPSVDTRQAADLGN